MQFKPHLSCSVRLAGSLFTASGMMAPRKCFKVKAVRKREGVIYGACSYSTFYIYSAVHSFTFGMGKTAFSRGSPISQNHFILGGVRSWE